MYENYFVSGWKNKIWTAWQIRFVETVAITHAMYEFAYDQFRLHIFISDCPHISAACFYCNAIHLLCPMYV